MAKKLRCYLSFHRWHRVKNPAGDGWHKECRDCGKFGDDDTNIPLASAGGTTQGGGV